VTEQQAQAIHPRTWRVRMWIRVFAVLVVAALCWEQSDVIRRAGLGEMPRTEVRNGYVFLAVLAVGLSLLVFRPVLRIDPTGEVYVRNPVGSRRFRVGEVTDVSIDQWGLVISLARGRTARSIIFQQTLLRFGEPRWFEVAEALTGVRPELPSVRRGTLR
jgi:hypothetical protein